MNLLILIPEEKETILLRRAKSAYFRSSGDKTAYMLPPCMILGEGGNYDERINIPEYFTLDGNIESNEFGSFIAIKENEKIEAIQEKLGLEKVKTGLFLSLRKDAPEFDPGLEKIRIKQLASVSLTDVEMKILRIRPLKRH